MKITMDIAFLAEKDRIKCVIHANEKEFKATKRITKEADRVSGIKRAKQAAYCAAMVRLHGYVCNNMINEVD